MRLSLIAAMADNRVIGRDNRLPWRLSADLQHFRRVTMGKPLLMGRRTYESIGRPLPGRHNIVLTRDPAYRAPGCTVVHSLDEALRAASDSEEIMVMGGAELYRQLLARAERLYLTLVHAEVEGDVHFPDIDPGEWREISREDFSADDNNEFDYSFVVLERTHRQRPRDKEKTYPGASAPGQSYSIRRVSLSCAAASTLNAVRLPPQRQPVSSACTPSPS